MSSSFISESKWDDLLTSIYATNEDLGAAAAEEAEVIIRAAASAGLKLRSHETFLRYQYLLVFGK